MTRTEFHPAKLGAFIVVALLLAMAAVILWGPLNGVWEKRFVIFFEETATGLDPGAPVRLNGVVIGRVHSIDLFYDRTNRFYSAVVVQLDRDRVKRISKGGHSFDDMLRHKEVSAQLGISGVVSFKLYVDLKVGTLRTNEYRPWKYSDYHEYYGNTDWIPARESTIAKVIDKLEDVLNSEGITNLMGSVATLLEESHTNRLVYKAVVAISNFNDFTTNLNQMLLSNTNDIRTIATNLAQLSTDAGPKLDTLLSNLNTAAESVRSNLDKLGPGVDSITNDFASLSTNLEARSAELGVVLRGAAPLPPQAAEDLRSLQDTIQSLQRLIEYAHRHPESFVRGRAMEK
jgi:paraquat-inducible protein B